MAKGSSVQALYELCKKTFAASGSASPSSTAIRKLSSLLDTITPAEVGLREDTMEDERGHGFFGSNLLRNSMRTARWAQPITYLHIYECDSFSIGIFCLPTSSVIPLHDHPGMTVLSKILYGSLHVKSYDWIEPPCLGQSGEPDGFPVRLAKLHMDTVLTAPCPTTVLYPKSGGNFHCFTAVTSCAVLDVLAPPFELERGSRATLLLAQSRTRWWQMGKHRLGEAPRLLQVCGGGGWQVAVGVLGVPARCYSSTRMRLQGARYPPTLSSS